MLRTIIKKLFNEAWRYYLRLTLKALPFTFGSGFVISYSAVELYTHRSPEYSYILLYIAYYIVLQFSLLVCLYAIKHLLSEQGSGISIFSEVFIDLIYNIKLSLKKGIPLGFLTYFLFIFSVELNKPHYSKDWGWEVAMGLIMIILTLYLSTRWYPLLSLAAFDVPEDPFYANAKFVKRKIIRVLIIRFLFWLPCVATIIFVTSTYSLPHWLALTIDNAPIINVINGIVNAVFVPVSALLQFSIFTYLKGVNK